ncbi:hypothetical protein ACHAPU_006299 [Fusarium lateritium]
MDSSDQIFRLNKADKDPTTPWTITHHKTGKRLCFINEWPDWQVRVRDEKNPEISGDKRGQWYIGHEKAGTFTWV